MINPFLKISYFFRSSAVKLTLFTALLFSIFSFILLGFIYFTLIENEKIAIDRLLREEIHRMETLYNKHGYATLERTIFLENLRDNKTLYAIYNAYGEKRSGNLKLEESRPFKQKIETRKYKVIDKNQQKVLVRHIRTAFVLLSGGHYLFVGQDIESLNSFSKLLFRVFIITVFLSLLLALLAGYLVNRNFSYRIEAINKVTHAVRKGILSQRIKRTYTRDELDLLGENLNEMLTKIELLMRASRQSGDNLAHDLRSPLSRLRSRLETAALRVSDQSAQQELIASAEDTTDLLKTFEAILRISRLEDGEQRGVFVETYPDKIIEDIKELYEPVCEEKNLLLTVSITSHHRILVDRTLLAQALSNLVDNALKYTSEGDQILIGYQDLPDQKVEFFIEDTGVGIPENKREEVKKRFVRLEEDRAKPGSGLGLSLVNAIAEIHNAIFILGTAHAKNEKTQTSGLRASLVFPGKA